MCCLCGSVCGMNVHKRCQKNVANNCGINTKDMAAVLNQLGISGDKLNASKRKKVQVVWSHFLNIQLFELVYWHVQCFLCSWLMMMGKPYELLKYGKS